jgi:two-component system sensor histidine kinase KdpD
MKDADSLFYLSAGPLGAILLGFALVPLREVTTASNLTFAFLVWTILVSEFGGRWPSVATALVSALSLDFFLTRPYLRLVIEQKNDVIAFAGLALCGLIVATFASRRRSRIASLRIARRRLDLLHETLGLLEPHASPESRLPQLLDEACQAFPIAAAVVRDTAEQVLAASERGYAPPPKGVLDPVTMVRPRRASRSAGEPDEPLPLEGARLALVAADKQVGWLDVWGNGSPASEETRRILSDVARVAAMALSRAGTLRPASP